MAACITSVHHKGVEVLLILPVYARCSIRKVFGLSIGTVMTHPGVSAVFIPLRL